MDLEDWELLPDDGFPEIHDDEGGKKIFSRKYYVGSGDPNRSSSSVFKMNYFTCPSSPKSQETHANPPPPPLVNPIQLDHELVMKEQVTYNKVPIELPSVKAPNIGDVETDQAGKVSQLFFTKMKENEFVDMKMDSPKSSGRGILPPQPQFDAAGAKELELELELELEGKSGNSKMIVEKEKVSMELDSEESENGGVNLWKWSLNGIGAICSFGVAAATICIIILGSHHRNKNQRQNQKLQFQIYADQKRMKQVAEHATKLNEAISAVRGVPVPLTRSAHFTFGGYYDGPLL